jgi:hypothetical protein
VARVCALSDARWVAVVASLRQLCRTLGWRVRAVPLAVGAEQASKHVASACDVVLELVSIRAGDPDFSERAPLVVEAVNDVRRSLDAP